MRPAAAREGIESRVYTGKNFTAQVCSADAPRAGGSVRPRAEFAGGQTAPSIAI